jgi:PKHD-type hydroxylase
MPKIAKYNAPLQCYAHMIQAFNAEEVEKIREIEELQTFQQGVIGGGTKSLKEMKKDRDSSVFFMNHDENTNWLYQKMGSLIGTANKDHFMYNVDDFGPMQYTKYELNGHYTWHWDVFFGYQTNQRKISVVVMLNDPEDYEGGDFQICINGNLDEIQTIRPNKGDALFFASWMPHRVTSVTSGERNTLVTWVTGPRES